MSSELFRKEAHDAVDNDSFCEPLRSRVRSYKLPAISALVLLAAIALTLIYGQASRKTKLPGFVTGGGIIEIATPSAGVVREVHVQHGDEVNKGDVLGVVEVDVLTRDGELNQAVSATLTSRAAAQQIEEQSVREKWNQKLQLLKTRHLSLVQQFDFARVELDISRRAVVVADTALKRDEMLVRSGFLAEAALQDRKAKLLELEGATARATRTAATAELQSDETSKEISSAETEMNIELSQLSQKRDMLTAEKFANEARRTILITAPTRGRINLTGLRLGASVLSGQIIASLVTESREGGTEAELYGPSRSIGLIKPDQRVWVRYAAYPFQKFGLAEATVSEVSTSPIRSTELPNGQGQALNAAAQTAEPLYRVTIKLKSNKIKLGEVSYEIRSGMTLDADIVHERRKLWEMALEPILAARENAKAQ